MNYLEAIEDYGEEKLEKDIKNVTESETYRDITFGAHAIVEDIAQKYELDEENITALDDYIFSKVVASLDEVLGERKEEKE